MQLQALNGMVNYETDTDAIISMFEDDRRKLSMLIEAIERGLTSLESTHAKDKSLLKALPSLNQMSINPRKFLAGCLAISLAHQYNRDESDLKYESFIPRYEIIGKMSTHLINLFMLFDVLKLGQIIGSGAIKRIVLEAVNCLCESGVLEQRNEKKRSRTEAKIRYNVDLSIKRYNAAEIYREPRRLFIHNRRPYYISKDFTDIIDVIKDNNNNDRAAEYESIRELTNLTNTKLFVDKECLEDCIAKIKESCVAVGAVGTSRQAMEAYTILSKEKAVDSSGVEQTTEASELKYGILTGLVEGVHSLLRGEQRVVTNEPSAKNTTKRMGWHKASGHNLILSSLMSLYTLYLLKESGFAIRDGFYYTYTMDFRGRIYTGSKVGYTHNKYIRYCLKIEGHDSRDVSGFKLEHRDLVAYNAVKGGVGLSAVNDVQKKLVAECFYEFGKLNKGGSTYLTYDDFIRRGIELYAANGARLGVDDWVIYNYYKRALFQGLGNNDTGYLFFRDATASGLQILALILGCKDEEVKKRLNLSSEDTWFDPYSYMIELFKSDFNINDSVSKYFKRSNLKPTIMLSNYNAKYVTCLGSFVNKLPLDISDAEYYDVKQSYDLFYAFVQDVFNGNKMFKHSSRNLFCILNSRGYLESDINECEGDESLKGSSLRQLRKIMPSAKLSAEYINCDVEDDGRTITPREKRYVIVMGDKFLVSHAYLCKRQKKVDIKPRKGDIDSIAAFIEKYRCLLLREPKSQKRTTINFNVNTGIFDVASTEIAFRPNLVHSIDALIIRKIIQRCNGPVLSIHDSIGVRVLDLDLLRVNIRNAYNSISFSCDGYSYKPREAVSGNFIMN